MPSRKGRKLNGGAVRAPPQLWVEEEILDFIDNTDELEVIVEGPTYPGPPLDHFDVDESYFLPTTGTKGLALILNIVEFRAHKQRIGSEKDVEHLSKLLTQLDYKLFPASKKQRERTSMSKQAMEDSIREFRDKCNQEKPESIIVFIGSHGEHPNQIITTDSKTLDLYQDIVDEFSHERCPGLKGKPKVFLTQACQDYPEERHDTDSSAFPLRRPKIEDVLVWQAVMPGESAQRDHYKGSWFVFCITNVLMKYALQWSSLNEMIDMVRTMLRNIKSMRGTEQVPTVANYNFKEFYFSGTEGLQNALRKYSKLPRGFRELNGSPNWTIVSTPDRGNCMISWEIAGSTNGRNLF